jgi:hypothetical protein
MRYVKTKRSNRILQLNMHGTASIKHRVSKIQHPVSRIQYPASRFFCIFLFILFIFLPAAAQDSLQTSDIFSIKPKLLIPQSRSEIQFQNIDLKYQFGSLKNSYQYMPNHLSSNPFGMDTRSGSFYTPTFVRDELNIMMNRPKDQAFVPVLGVAFIAAQMIGKYLLVERELQIKPENILKCQDQLPILEELWQNNPQTCDQLYKIDFFNKTYTFNELENNLSRLVDEKLVKVKRLENDELQYFPAIDKFKLQATLKEGRKDSLHTTVNISQIDSLLIYFDNNPR